MSRGEAASRPPSDSSNLAHVSFPQIADFQSACRASHARHAWALARFKPARGTAAHLGGRVHGGGLEAASPRGRRYRMGAAWRPPPHEGDAIAVSGERAGAAVARTRLR